MSTQLITLDNDSQAVVIDGVQIPIVSMDDSDFWRDLAANTLNYWDEEGNFVIASNTPEHQAEKAAWVKRTWPDGNIPKWEGDHGS